MEAAFNPKLLSEQIAAKDQARLLNRREKDRIRKQRQRMRKKVAELVAAGVDPGAEMIRKCEMKRQNVLKKANAVLDAEKEEKRKKLLLKQNGGNENKTDVLKMEVEKYRKDPTTRCGKFLKKLFAAQKMAKITGKEVPNVPLPVMPDTFSSEPSSSSSPSLSSYLFEPSSSLSSSDVLMEMCGEPTISGGFDFQMFGESLMVKNEEEEEDSFCSNMNDGSDFDLDRFADQATGFLEDPEAETADVKQDEKVSLDPQVLAELEELVKMFPLLEQTEKVEKTAPKLSKKEANRLRQKRYRERRKINEKALEEKLEELGQSSSSASSGRGRKRILLTEEERKNMDRVRKRVWRAKLRSEIEGMLGDIIPSGSAEQIAAADEEPVEKAPTWRNLQGEAKVMADRIYRKRYREIMRQVELAQATDPVEVEVVDVEEEKREKERIRKKMFRANRKSETLLSPEVWQAVFDNLPEQQIKTCDKID